MQVSERLNNRYEVIRELGDGGFGKTFLVRDLQMPSARECVVKQLKPLHENAEIYAMVQDRFQREAAILERLGEHDQVPRLYAYFCEADLFYLVEEYVEGDTLTQKVQREGAQSEAIVKAMLVNLLPAIVHVHQQKIVHRDIKPDNILLRRSDQKPVLIDFGAVKETMATVLNTQGDSSRSIVVGTPGYMPSEQMVGRPVYGSDLYSLGLTAIYMLTGKLPQELDTDPQTGAFLWRGYVPQVSEGLAAVLDRAIQINPGSRFGSAQEMFMALNGLAVGVTIPPNGMWPQGQPQATPNPGPLTPPQVTTPPIGATPMITMPLAPDTEMMQTRAVIPPSPAYQPTAAAAPTTAAPTIAAPTTAPIQTVPAAAGGTWKKAAMTGGIIGLSILMGAVVLKMQRSPVPVSNANTTGQISPAPEKPQPTAPVVSSGTNASSGATTAATTTTTPAKPPVTAASATQAVEGTDATIVGAAGSKNVRSGPGTQYDSPHVAYPGDRIKVLATSRDEGGYTWHKVYFPQSGAEGWIATQLLRMDAGQTTPEDSAPEPPEKPTTQSPKPDDVANVTNATIAGASGSKNIRSGPGTNFDSPHLAYPGDRVKIIDTAQDKGGFTWYKVSFPKSGAEGWIAAQLVRAD
jgi:serine/threonine protein kinase, bacterial